MGMLVGERYSPHLVELPKSLSNLFEQINVLARGRIRCGISLDHTLAELHEFSNSANVDMVLGLAFIRPRVVSCCIFGLLSFRLWNLL